MKLQVLHDKALPGPWTDGHTDEIEDFTSVNSPAHGSFMYVVHKMEDAYNPEPRCVASRELTIYLRNHTENILRLIRVADELSKHWTIENNDAVRMALAPFIKE